ncbi:MAG: STAS domain-containing protein [Chitinophagaceae bacterium]
MKVKIDTKEKFIVLTPNEEHLSDNLTEELSQTIQSFLNSNTKNIVLSLKDVKNIDNAALALLANLQQEFYEHNASFIICEMNSLIEEKLNDLKLLETMNVTPTETEAADIVQMEEIERELNDEI